MIIDMHTHVFPEKIAGKAVSKLSANAHIHPHTDGTPKGLISSMEEAGVSLSVIVPVATSKEQVPKLNDAAARLNEQFGNDGLLSFGAMHPEYEDFKEELLRIKESGLKGIKIHPVYQEVAIDDIRFLRILYRCAELGLTVVTHAGLDVGLPGKVFCSPQMCLNAITKLSDGQGTLKNDFALILAHMGGWRNWDEVLSLLPETGAYIDTSFSFGELDALDDGYWTKETRPMLHEEQFLELVRAFGAGKVVFGTDSPWTVQKESLSYIRALPLSDDEKELILAKNAMQILGMSPGIDS